MQGEVFLLPRSKERRCWLENERSARSQRVATRSVAARIAAEAAAAAKVILRIRFYESLRRGKPDAAVPPPPLAICSNWAVIPLSNLANNRRKSVMLEMEQVPLRPANAVSSNVVLNCGEKLFSLLREEN